MFLCLFRGEHFRHSQNLRRSRAHLSHATTYSYNDPSLPYSHIFAYHKTSSEEQQHPSQDREPFQSSSSSQGVPQQTNVRDVAVPGPSWSRLFGEGAEPPTEEDIDKLIWRMKALSLLYSHLPPSPGSAVRLQGNIAPLTQMCFRALLSIYSGDEFVEDLVPALPPHLRRDMLRWSAAYMPLPSAKLYALCEDGHADGELIVIGPQASLLRDHFKQSTRITHVRSDGHNNIERDNFAAEEEGDDSWDSPSHAYAPSPLYCLALVSVTLSISTLLTFPPTLTHLALLGLSEPAPVHRLPRICPLVEIFDLSFNPWLNQNVAGKAILEEESEESIVRRVEWSRWTRLRVLALRECGVKEDLIPFVNGSRWVDVEIIGLQSKDAMVSSRVQHVGLRMRNMRLDN